MSRSIEPSEIHLLGILPAEDQLRVFPLREPITLGPVMYSAYPLKGKEAIGAFRETLAPARQAALAGDSDAATRYFYEAVAGRPGQW